METKVYKSKFGWAVFLFMAALFAVVSWISFEPGKGILENVVIAILFIGILGLFAAISVSIRYSISATELHIRCLPFYNKSIGITSIKKVEVTRNFISSPAPSLDRIEIYFGKHDSIVISPKNKLQFMNDLQMVNPKIQLFKS